jgi:transcriptional regulator with XRE-family HTH domain
MRARLNAWLSPKRRGTVLETARQRGDAELGPVKAAFGTLIREARERRGISLAALAEVTFVSRGWINNVEAGRRWPSHEWVEQAEGVLKAEGLLIPAWQEGQKSKESEANLRGILGEADRESRLMLATELDGIDLDQISESASDLSVSYLSTPARPMLEQARTLRHELMRRLNGGLVRPHELADLYVALGRVSGVISYAALDLGSPRSAATHAGVTWKMGDAAGHDELRAWARGTQSLIARFDKNYPLAQDFIDDGLRYATTGTSEVRLLCGAAQCAANMGDKATALARIEEAHRSRDRARPDPIEGLFGFSPAKQAYYSASALMWLDDKAALRIAEQSALSAIDIWQDEPVSQRSLDDEALAHVYLATARIKLDEVEGAMAAVRPIIELPEDRQISWIRKRVSELAAILDSDRFRRSVVAAGARDELLSASAG